jgi:hypothetical protein
MSIETRQVVKLSLKVKSLESKVAPCGTGLVNTDKCSGNPADPQCHSHATPSTKIAAIAFF